MLRCTIRRCLDEEQQAQGLCIGKHRAMHRRHCLFGQCGGNGEVVFFFKKYFYRFTNLILGGMPLD